MYLHASTASTVATVQEILRRPGLKINNINNYKHINESPFPCNIPKLVYQRSA